MFPSSESSFSCCPGSRQDLRHKWESVECCEFVLVGLGGSGKGSDEETEGTAITNLQRQPNLCFAVALQILVTNDSNSKGFVPHCQDVGRRLGNTTTVTIPRFRKSLSSVVSNNVNWNTSVVSVVGAAPPRLHVGNNSSKFEFVS